MRNYFVFLFTTDDDEFLLDSSNEFLPSVAKSFSDKSFGADFVFAAEAVVNKVC